MELTRAFTTVIHKQYQWTPTTKVLLAVSGGVDSMVLLDLVACLPMSLKPWFGVAHVNHQLRAASDEEEQFLAEYCQERKIPFYSRRWEHSQQPATGVEVAARTMRYTFFQQVMEEQQATQLVTAHHGDDQLETILMRLVRGSHLSGLTGIQPKRSFGMKGQLVRPLLSFSKSDLLNYSLIRHVPYYEDESNSQLVYTRNRYRNQIVPLLKEENSQALKHAADFASDLAELLQLVQPLIQEALTRVVIIEEVGKVVLDNSKLVSYDLAMQYQLLNHLFIQLLEEQDFTFQRQHIQQVLDLVHNSKPNGRLDLQNKWQVVKSYQQLTVMNQPSAYLNEESKNQEAFNESLELGKWCVLPDGDRIGLFSTDSLPNEGVSSQGLKLWLDPQEIMLPLTIRHRQNGDRMTLKGKSVGTRKIKNILIDQKIPLEERNQAYLVTDAKENIIWLIKYKKSQLSIAEETDKIQYILVYEKKGLY